MTTLPTADPTPPAARLMRLIATGFGSGYAPVAPGTFGSLVGLGLAWGLAHLGLPWHLVVIAVLFVVGVPVCTTVARLFGEHDPSRIVWDEVVGIQCTLALAPLHWGTFAAGFVLFRLFDIVKPFPIKRLERLPQGLGIMADDVGAGLYGGLVLWLSAHFLGWPAWTI